MWKRKRIINGTEKKTTNATKSKRRCTEVNRVDREDMVWL